MSEPRQQNRPNAPVVEVTRTFKLSAAHRLHSDRFSAAENSRIYGRCNNPNGHGHTYLLAVTIRGRVNPETGFVEDGRHLDELVHREIIRRYDRTNLNVLITAADGPTSTTEVLAAVFWRILDGVLPSGRLWRIRLEETLNNFFELDRQGAEGPAQTPVPTSMHRAQKASLA